MPSMWHVNIGSIWSFAWNVPSLYEQYCKKDWFHSIDSCANVTQQTAYQRTTNRKKEKKKTPKILSFAFGRLHSILATQNEHFWFACFAIERDAIPPLPFVSTDNFSCTCLCIYEINLESNRNPSRSKINSTLLKYLPSNASDCTHHF